MGTYTAALGEDLSATLTKDQVAFFGVNRHSRLGNGKVQVPGEENLLEEFTMKLPGVDGIALGSQTVCAWRKGGEVWCWGGNEHGTAALGSGQQLVLTPTKLAW